MASTLLGSAATTDHRCLQVPAPRRYPLLSSAIRPDHLSPHNVRTRRAFCAHQAGLDVLCIPARGRCSPRRGLCSALRTEDSGPAARNLHARLLPGTRPRILGAPQTSGPLGSRMAGRCCPFLEPGCHPSRSDPCLSVRARAGSMTGVTRRATESS